MRPPSAFREPDPADADRGPWRPPGDGSGEGRGRPPGAPERAFNAPWPALALALVLVVVYGLQVVTGDAMAAADRFGFHVRALAQGEWTGLFTALFVHAGWMHALLNALAALAFGAPVARRFGLGGAGPAAYLVFFIGCGLLGSLGFAALQGGRDAVLVGASGAIAGLMGAASRMAARHGGRLARFTSPTVLTMAAAWLAVNLLFALTGFGGATGGAPVAWQAHLAGYAAGLLLIGPALALSHPVDASA